MILEIESTVARQAVERSGSQNMLLYAHKGFRSLPLGHRHHLAPFRIPDVREMFIMPDYGVKVARSVTILIAEAPFTAVVELDPRAQVSDVVNVYPWNAFIHNNEPPGST